MHANWPAHQHKNGRGGRALKEAGRAHLRCTRPETGAWKADAEAQKRQIARTRNIIYSWESRDPLARARRIDSIGHSWTWRGMRPNAKAHPHRGPRRALRQEQCRQSGMQRPLLHVASLVLRENEGLEKLPASPLSPRQVLLTDAEDLDATESWSAARERRASRRERGLVALGHGPESRQRGHAAPDVCVRAMRSHRG